MNRIKKCIIPFLTALITAAEALVTAALCIHLENYTAQTVMLASVFLTVFVLLFLVIKKSKKASLIKAFIAVIILPVLFASVYFVSDRAVKSNVYNFEDVDNGKKAVFSDKSVMLIVPHEDDEVFLLGGTIEEYIRYGSEVNVVFATNGDAFLTEEIKEKRLNEAISALSFMGVDEKHVVFLGY